MNQLKITSDVKNRLRKVREGVVYNDIYAVIDEVIIQNPKRAGATKVKINLEDNSLVISDNGIGCPKPEVLFTLDFSGFGNGFGEGFTSVYMIADSLMVRSLDWEGYLNIQQAMKDKKSDLDVEITKLTSPLHQGFELSLIGEKIQYYREELIDYIKQAAGVVPGIEFILNERVIEKKNIFHTNWTSDYTKYMSNRKYEGMLSLSNKFYESKIKVYYEHRYVMDLQFHGMSGSILLKPNAVNLRTPDRRAIIYDKKERALIRQLEKDAKILLLDLIKSGKNEDMKDFAEYISSYLTVDEYLPFLMVESSSILNQYETREMKKQLEEQKADFYGSDLNNFAYAEMEDEAIDYNVVASNDALSIPSEAVSTAVKIAENSFITAIQVDNSDSNEVVSFQKAIEHKRDTKRIEKDKKMTSFITKKENKFIQKKDMDSVSIRNIKNKKNIIWVERDAAEEYASLIDKYEYYGVYTFVSPHILFDNALRHLDIPHISTLEEQAMKKDYKVTKIGARTKKEERVMEILGFIEKTLHLEETFNISSIDCKLIVHLRGTKIYQERLNVKGYAQGRSIHLNRKDLDFGSVSSLQLGKNSFGIHDIKFILTNLDVIAHELAHVIYNTEDNTKNHFEKQISIQNKISNAVMKSEQLW